MKTDCNAVDVLRRDRITRVDYFLPAGAPGSVERMALDMLKSRLALEFGGYTTVAGIGSWCGIEEPVEVVTVFPAQGLLLQGVAALLENIATTYGQAAQQTCVLFVLNSNTPHFITI